MSSEHLNWLGKRVTIRDSGSVKQWTVAGFTPSVDRAAPWWANLTDASTGELKQGPVSLSRLELMPDPKLRDTTPGYLSSSGYKCTADEATEWMVFVMMQAADLFERVPADGWLEMERLMLARGLGRSGPEITAARAYYDSAETWYRENGGGAA